MTLRGGKPRKNAPAKKKGGPKPVAGEHEFENYLASSEYEVLQDPYRGLQARQQSLETGTRITTPWNACVWGTLNPEETELQHMDEVAVVRHVGHAACPSLKNWTRNLQESSKKRTKGKRRAKLPSSIHLDDIFAIGTRPTEASYRCLCDYNPLCLASLGGIVNEVLVERSKERYTNELKSDLDTEAANSDEPESIEVDIEPLRKPLHESLKADDTDGGSRVSATSVLELLNNSNQSSVKKKDDDVFEFMEEDANCKRKAVKLKPLIQNNKEEEGDPADVYTMKLPRLEEDKIQYSPATTTQLRSLRKSIILDTDRIKNYAASCLGLRRDNEQLYMDEYLQAVVSWEQSLRFISPARHDEVGCSNNRSTLSIPPGIENLGATCYLNTQLQCLAQNSVFLNGIFSWRAGSSTHSMNPVISKMQSLLAQMVVGGECKLSTLDFSNALGLGHNEQQDPNEFARLLFERMEESFQQCDTGGDLKNLLRSIFQGTTTYETICMTCGKSSQRSETFMDLNLPIVRREKSKGKTKNKKINDYFGSKMIDTDVQHCLNEYLCAELLDGDNQYFCDKCGSKQDAKRVLKLTALPPVLNIQLSRYVFDLSQFVKKKLSDKVLLPTTLTVPKHDGSSLTYRLCAVMLHRGISAYTGHYVAEAMDWVTGQWFEFNDQAVQHLPAGPTSSINPQAAAEDDEVQSIPSGSKDAYNMYYVDENFLKESALEEVSRRERRCGNYPNSSVEDLHDVITQVSKQRDGKYAHLYDMCFADGLNADRLRRRKIGIRKHLFRDSSSLAMAKEGSFAWVDGDILRQYLRLDHSLDERIASEGPILHHKPLLCEHNRMHPTISRKGKILPLSTFKAYTSLLKAEQSLLRRERKLFDCVNPVCDVVIDLSENLICKECSKAYGNLLASRINQLRNIKALYDCINPDLDSKNLLLHYDEGELSCPDDASVYAVSKRMITKYRNAVKGLLQTYSMLNDKATGPKMTCQDNGVFEGLDGVDLSLFEGEYIADSTKMINAKKADTTVIALDKYFNSEIICVHRNCNLMNDRRFVRLLSWEAWQKLKAVFPEAIELKKARVLTGTQLPEDSGCAECVKEKNLTENFLADLKQWSRENAQNPELKDLLRQNPGLSQKMDACNLAKPLDSYRLVHRRDVSNWRSAVKMLSQPRKLYAENVRELKGLLASTISPKHRKDTMNYKRVPRDSFGISLIPLICQGRKRVKEECIFRSTNSNANRGENTRILARWVTVLSDATHRSYISSLAKLLQIIDPTSADEEKDANDRTCFSENRESVYFDIDTAANSYHPRIQNIENAIEDSLEGAFTFALNGSPNIFSISPPISKSGQCSEEELSYLCKEDESEDTGIDCISIDSNEATKENEKKVDVIGTNPQEPILVESDAECVTTILPKQYKVRVFELSDTGSVKEAVETLEQRSAAPPKEEEEGICRFLRRSMRKKKPRYPLGCLKNEIQVELKKHFNMAAVKLFLWERCQVSVTGRRLTLSLASPGNQGNHLEIRSEWIRRPISDLVKEIQAKCHDELSNEEPCDHPIELYIFHQRDNTGSLQTLQESVMDSLLQAANIQNSEDTKGDNSEKRKRKRSTERGFQGTLLHSVVPTSNPSEGIKIVDDMDTGKCNGTTNDICCETLQVEDRKTTNANMDGITVSKKARLYTSDSDDDIPGPSPFASEVKMTPTHKAGSKMFDAKQGDTQHDIIVIDKESEVSDSLQSSAENRRRMLEATNANSKMQEYVIASLLEIFEKSAIDQSKCLDAVAWTMKMHPEEKNQQVLLEAAVNKVLL